MIREILGRIPDYRIDQAGTEFYLGNPALYGVVQLPVTFTPGSPVGIARPY